MFPLDVYGLGIKTSSTSDIIDNERIIYNVLLLLSSNDTLPMTYGPEPDSRKNISQNILVVCHDTHNQYLIMIGRISTL